MNDNLGQVIFLEEGWVLHGLSHWVCLDTPFCRGPLPIRCGAGSAVKGHKRGTCGSFTKQGPGLFTPINCGECLASSQSIIPATSPFCRRSSSRWRNLQWIGGAGHVGERTRPTQRNARGVASSGRMAKMSRMSHRSNPRVRGELPGTTQAVTP